MYYEQDPCLAFQRRPQLRHYVYSVTFSSSMTVNRYIPNESTTYICQQLSLLTALNRIQWGSSSDIIYASAATFKPIARAIGLLQAFQELHLPFLAEPDYLDSVFQPLRFTCVTAVTTSRSALTWLQGHLPTLRELNITLTIDKMPDLLHKFRALRRLSLSPVADVPLFLDTIRDMHCLNDLTLGIKPDLFRRWDAPISRAVKLPELRSLKLNVESSEAILVRYGKTSIPSCYQLIAAHSQRLETLGVTINDSIVHRPIEGDRIFYDIMNTHATSIRTIRLDDMSVTQETLARLFSQCTRLEELGLRVNSRGMTLMRLSPLGPLAVNLRHLTLTLGSSGRCEDMETERFFAQEMPYLKRLHIRNVSHSNAAPYIVWERFWVYDEILAAPRQVIAKTSTPP